VPAFARIEATPCVRVCLCFGFGLAVRKACLKEERSISPNCLSLGSNSLPTPISLILINHTHKQTHTQLPKEDKLYVDVEEKKDVLLLRASGVAGLCVCVCVCVCVCDTVDRCMR
jgi:hypothetical protein